MLAPNFVIALAPACCCSFVGLLVFAFCLLPFARALSLSLLDLRVSNANS